MILGKHSKDCAAARAVKNNEWKHPWCEASPRTVWGTKQTPRVRGYSVWLVFSCNDTYCSAKLAINESEFIKGWK